MEKDEEVKEMARIHDLTDQEGENVQGKQEIQPMVKHTGKRVVLVVSLVALSFVVIVLGGKMLHRNKANTKAAQAPTPVEHNVGKIKAQPTFFEDGKTYTLDEIKQELAAQHQEDNHQDEATIEFEGGDDGDGDGDDKQEEKLANESIAEEVVEVATVAKGAPIVEKTVEEIAPVEEVPANEELVKEVAPVEEAPVEEVPVEEVPANEELVKEVAPVEEASVEEIVNAIQANHEAEKEGVRITGNGGMDASVGNNFSSVDFVTGANIHINDTFRVGFNFKVSGDAVNENEPKRILSGSSAELEKYWINNKLGLGITAGVMQNSEKELRLFAETMLRYKFGQDNTKVEDTMQQAKKITLRHVGGLGYSFVNGVNYATAAYSMEFYNANGNQFLQLDFGVAGNLNAMLQGQFDKSYGGATIGAQVNIDNAVVGIKADLTPNKLINSLVTSVSAGVTFALDGKETQDNSKLFDKNGKVNVGSFDLTKDNPDPKSKNPYDDVQNQTPGNSNPDLTTGAITEENAQNTQVVRPATKTQTNEFVGATYEEVQETNARLDPAQQQANPSIQAGTSNPSIGAGVTDAGTHVSVGGRRGQQQNQELGQ